MDGFSAQKSSWEIRTPKVKQVPVVYLDVLVKHPPHGLTFRMFGDAFLLTTAVQSGELSYAWKSQEIKIFWVSQNTPVAKIRFDSWYWLHNFDSIRRFFFLTNKNDWEKNKPHFLHQTIQSLLKIKEKSETFQCRSDTVNKRVFVSQVNVKT